MRIEEYHGLIWFGDEIGFLCYCKTRFDLVDIGKADDNLEKL